MAQVIDVAPGLWVLRVQHPDWAPHVDWEPLDRADFERALELPPWMGS